MSRPGPLVGVAPDRVTGVGGHMPAKAVASEREQPKTPALAEGRTVMPVTFVVPALLPRQGLYQVRRRLL